MFKVIVDADACPKACLRILQKHKKTNNYRLLTVSSYDHQIKNEDHLTVGKGADAADWVVMNNTEAGDLVITQDWGLAALILGKGAFALSPTGRIYTEDSIDFLLEERFIKAKHRRAGGRTKGPAQRSEQDDTYFERNFLKLLTDIKAMKEQEND